MAKTKCKLKSNEEYQTLIFNDLERFYNKARVKEWVKKKDGFILMTSKGKHAVAKYKGNYHVRQKNPNKFKRNSLRCIKVCNGVKAVVGVLK